MKNHFHVRGFMDQDKTATPFEMVVLNKMSRFHLPQRCSNEP